jgi:uncharacterized protein (TIGR02271 family)
MLNEAQTREVIGSTAYSSEGEKIGKVGQLFLDDQTGRPEFVTVSTGMFGTSESFVPVADASLQGDRLTVPYTKDTVKDAPRVELDGPHLDESEEQRLYDYYKLNRAGGDVSVGSERGYDPAAGTGRYGDRDSSVPADRRGTSGTGTAGTGGDEAMTLSEERVRVGTTAEETGRVRLRKYVTTEQETVTVPVRKEKAVLEREPVTEANRGEALEGPAISEAEHEVVLTEERPVVEKTTEPVERVRLGTETDVDEQAVTEEVRKERLDVEGDVEDRRL